MNQLKIFENQEFGNIRTVLIEDKPYFVAGDVAKALGYANTRDAISKHCRWVAKCDIPHPQSRTKTIEVNAIPEGDIYRLIAHSELPTAEKFESWVFDEVLPSIRKHGAYMTAETLEAALLNPDAMIQVLTSLKEEREKRIQLEATNKRQHQIIGELKPKADYTDRILQSKSLVNVNQIAKDYGVSAKAFNKKLFELGVQYFQGGQWLLYSKYQKKGYTSSETFDFEHTDGTQDVKMRTKWTQKGRLFIYELLKKNGIIPLIEQDKVS